MNNTELPTVESAVLAKATEQTLGALQDIQTPRRMLEYYNPDSDYAGATFACLEPRNHVDITSTDLLAVTTLAVDIPVMGIRRLLEDDELRSTLREAFLALPRCSLEETTNDGIRSMEEYYDRVKESLAKAHSASSNPWVTASKIVARKRPDLYPVRDNVVCKFLGIHRLGDRAKDWLVFRELLRNDGIQRELQRVVRSAKNMDADSSAVFDEQPLRLLDVALWTTGRQPAGSLIDE